MCHLIEPELPLELDKSVHLRDGQAHYNITVSRVAMIQELSTEAV
jgi:hypothetical protein